MNHTTVVLLRSDLTDRGACPPGLRLFDEFAAAQGNSEELRIPFAGLLWASCSPLAREFVEWAQDEGLLPYVNAPRADLCGADLEGANLRSADLRSADLEGANLRSADLEGANLRSARLVGANLRGARLVGADLRGARLVGADLCGADLRGANLRSANLEGADLRGARRWSDDPPVSGWTLRDGALERIVL